MEDSDLNLIRRLCSRAGEVMEDASVVGIIWDPEDGISVEERLDTLARAAGDVQALVGAARVLSR